MRKMNDLSELKYNITCQQEHTAICIIHIIQVPFNISHHQLNEVNIMLYVKLHSNLNIFVEQVPTYLIQLVLFRNQQLFVILECIQHDLLKKVLEEQLSLFELQLHLG